MPRRFGRIAFGQKVKSAMSALENVEHGVVVKLEYALQIEEEMVESTDDEGPIEFLQGYGEIIPGLEAALYGMEIGQETVHGQLSEEFQVVGHPPEIRSDQGEARIIGGIGPSIGITVEGDQ